LIAIKAMIFAAFVIGQVHESAKRDNCVRRKLFDDRRLFNAPIFHKT